MLDRYDRPIDLLRYIVDAQIFMPDNIEAFGPNDNKDRRLFFCTESYFWADFGDGKSTGAGLNSYVMHCKRCSYEEAELILEHALNILIRERRFDNRLGQHRHQQRRYVDENCELVEVICEYAWRMIRIIDIYRVRRYDVTLDDLMNEIINNYAKLLCHLSKGDGQYLRSFSDQETNLAFKSFGLKLNDLINQGFSKTVLYPTVVNLNGLLDDIVVECDKVRMSLLKEGSLDDVPGDLELDTLSHSIHKLYQQILLD